MGLTQAQRNARNLLREMSIEDPNCELRRACAHLWLSENVLRNSRKQAAKGDSAPLENILASLEALGVAPDMARRICGMLGLDSDGLKRRLDAASDDGPATSSKAARATPASEVQSENDAESEGTRPLQERHSERAAHAPPRARPAGR